PAYLSTYYSHRSSGGGAVQDALTHILNAGQWCVGNIDRVVADAAHLKVEGVDVEDTVHVIARHGDVMASYALNQHQAPNETTITVICERGTARSEMDTGRARSWARRWLRPRGASSPACPLRTERWKPTARPFPISGGWNHTSHSSNSSRNDPTRWRSFANSCTARRC